MQRVGWLFNYVGLQDASANSPGFQYFNSIHAHVGNKNNFAAPTLGINQSYIDATTSVIVNDVVNPFTEVLFDNLRDKTMTCWQKMSSVPLPRRT